jgi:hypothetical protein
VATNETDTLHALTVLVGTWRTAAPGMDAQGETTFEWLPGGGFLIQRGTVDRHEFPNSISLIGPPGAMAACSSTTSTHAAWRGCTR